MDIMLWILVLLIGLAMTFMVWSVYRIFSSVPEEDRSYLDRPPAGFRWSWPLINMIAYYLGDLISKNYRYSTGLRLRRAGVEYTLNVEQFFAGKVLASLIAALLVALVQGILENPSWLYCVLAAIGGFFYPEIWLKETMDARTTKLFKALPFYLDVITLSVESGTSLTNGINQAVLKGPEGPLKVEFGRVLRDIRAGKPRVEALRDFSARVSMDSVSNVVSSMIQAEKTGAPLGPVLRAQSDQLRSERFLKAEKLAMEAPVKLLGPLIMFIFPTTFLVIIFVMLSKAIGEGVITWAPLVWAFSNP
ncbi:MAG: secretion system protein F [Proteobacteria bacterium]|nr:MAG: secretion system protein F [Pseudomonadota bacterium]